MENFSLELYLGKWYQLMHYPSWFQKSDTYNTTAVYSLDCDENIIVTNSTISNGIPIQAVGSAVYFGCGEFRVDFPNAEIDKLLKSGEFNYENNSPPGINYVVYEIICKKGKYEYSIVTDPKMNSLFVLSRTPNPPLNEYNSLMKYVIQNFDRNRLVQTPHFR